jgi:LacI family gluconate utilization system Gnt-I transcriptional repressor
MKPKPAKVIKRKGRRGSGSITLHDVAKIAGVSAITASRVLNSPHLVAAETQELVREAIRSTGYTPNLIAGSLASSRSRLVAMIVPTVYSPMFSSMIETISASLGAAGYQVMIGLSGYFDSKEDQLLAAVLSRKPDGIILTGVVHSQECRRQLLLANIPVVETWDLTPTPIGLVIGFSHEKVGREMARYMFARGVRHPVIVTADDPRALLRSRGFSEAAAELGIPMVPVSSVPAPSIVGNGRTAFAELLERKQAIDGVVCSSDVLALGVLQEARARGIDVPGKLAVMGFGNQSYSAALEPALTTVAVDGVLIGKRSAEFIIRGLAGDPITPLVEDVGFTILKRTSA